MYTGIVQGLEKIIAIRQGDNFRTLVIANDNGFFDDIFPGASVAINGTCLTVTAVDKAANTTALDVSALTDAVTTLQYLQPGDEVNVERSTKAGLENGGHCIYGHVEGMATVTSLLRTGETLHLDIQIPDGNINYFFLKGFISLHGCSLTVNRVDRASNEISVDLIPETLRRTTLNKVRPGDKLNYEVDQVTRTLVDTLKGIWQADGWAK